MADDDDDAPDDRPGSNKGQMTDERLKALIARELSIANSDRAAASARNARALRFYQGDVTKDLPSFKGRSQLVSTDLSRQCRLDHAADHAAVHFMRELSSMWRRSASRTSSGPRMPRCS